MESLFVKDLADARPAEAGSERRLVERAVRGEPGSFGELYRRHVDAVYNYVHFRVRDDALAEDLTQDVFVSALKAISTLEQPDRFRPWLMRIAHNRVLNHWRARASRPVEASLADTSMAAEGPSRGLVDGRHAERMDQRLVADDVLAATWHLTDLQRQVVALRFVAGLSVAETAAVMGRRVGAVKNLQHHALAALRRHLSEASGP